MKKLFFFCFAMMIFSSISMAEEPAKKDLISSLQEQCFEGEVGICDALDIRARKRESRCNTCTLEADKSFCLGEARCWRELYSLHKRTQQRCKDTSKDAPCLDPVAEHIKKTFALCQMRGEICS